MLIPPPLRWRSQREISVCPDHWICVAMKFRSLQVGDVVVAVDGMDVRGFSPQDLQQYLRQHLAGRIRKRPGGGGIKVKKHKQAKTVQTTISFERLDCGVGGASASGPGVDARTRLETVLATGRRWDSTSDNEGGDAASTSLLMSLDSATRNALTVAGDELRSVCGGELSDCARVRRECWQDLPLCMRVLTPIVHTHSQDAPRHVCPNTHTDFLPHVCRACASVAAAAGRAIIAVVPPCTSVAAQTLATVSDAAREMTEHMLAASNRWRLSQLTAVAEWLTSRYAAAVSRAVGRKRNLHVKGAVERRMLRNACRALGAFVVKHCSGADSGSGAADTELQSIGVRAKLLVQRRLEWIEEAAVCVPTFSPHARTHIKPLTATTNVHADGVWTKVASERLTCVRAVCCRCRCRCLTVVRL